MKRFFIYIRNLFFGKKVNVSKKYAEGGKLDEQEKIEIEESNRKIVLDSRTESIQVTKPETLSETLNDTIVESDESLKEQVEPENNMRYMSFVETPNKSNRERVIEVIELNSEANPSFTTTMVYKWLGGNMPVLSVRKCIYTLHSKGYLQVCKKTIGENKKVKFYSLKNVQG